MGKSIIFIQEIRQFHTHTPTAFLCLCTHSHVQSFHLQGTLHHDCNLPFVHVNHQCSHTHACTHTHKQTDRYALMHTPLHSLTHIHKHTRTHTHTYILYVYIYSLSLCQSLSPHHLSLSLFLSLFLSFSLSL